MTTRSGTYKIRVDFDAKQAGKSVRGLNQGMGSMHENAKMMAKFFASTLKTFADFEQSMAAVKAVSGATAAEFEALTEKAREMGRETVFTAQQSADALKFIAMAGIEAKDAIVILPDILNLAAAGSLELAKAADLATNIMTVFGKEASDMGNVVDILAHTAASSNTNVQQLASAVSYAGPIARAAGVDMETLAAMVGQLGNAGIQGYRAGTGLRSMITSLVKPTRQAMTVFERLGISVVDSTGKMRSVLDIVKDLERVGASAGDLARIFSSRSVPAVKALMNSMAAGEMDPFIQEMYNAEGAAKKMADTMLDTTHGSVTLLKSKMTDLALTIGENLAPILNRILDSLNKFVGWIGKAAEKSPKLFTALAVGGAVLATLLVGLTGVGIAVGGLTLGIAGLTTVVGAAGVVFGVILGPIGLIIAAVTALATVVGVVLYKAWKGNNKSLEPVRKLMVAVVELAKALWERFKQFYKEALQPLIAEFVKLGKLLAPIVIPALKILGTIVGTQLKNVFTVITGVIKILTALIRGDFMGAWQALKNMVIGVAKNIITGIKSILKALPDKFIPDGWIRSIESAEQYLDSAMNNMADKSTETSNEINQHAKGISFEYKQTAYGIKTDMAASMTASGESVKQLSNTSSQESNRIVGFFRKGFDQIKANVKDTITTSINDVKALGQAIGSAVSAGVRLARSAFDIFKRAIDSVKQAFGGLKQTAQNSFNTMASMVASPKRAIESLKGVVRSVADSFRGLISKAQEAANKAKSLFNKAKNWVTSGGGSSGGSFGGGSSGGGSSSSSKPRMSKSQAQSQYGAGALSHAASQGIEKGYFKYKGWEWYLWKGKVNPVMQLAEGGIVKATPGGTPAIIGEGGQDEAVIPLDRMGSGNIESLLRELIKTVQQTGSSPVFIGNSRIDDLTFNSGVRNNNIRRSQRNNPWN